MYIVQTCHQCVQRSTQRDAGTNKLLYTEAYINHLHETHLRLRINRTSTCCCERVKDACSDPIPRKSEDGYL